MPYCTDPDRHEAVTKLRTLFEELDRDGVASVDISTLSSGQLNFIITGIVCEWAGTNPNYDRMLRAHGTFGAAGTEYYRRAVAPYEDQKIRENGDVYPTRGQHRAS